MKNIKNKRKPYKYKQNSKNQWNTIKINDHKNKRKNNKHKRKTVNIKENRTHKGKTIQIKEQINVKENITKYIGNTIKIKGK